MGSVFLRQGHKKRTNIAERLSLQKQYYRQITLQTGSLADTVPKALSFR